ncbi:MULTISPECIES: methyl-accepting chemotaxis protein [unclassified Paenibacillus]|uniref:methyl-accepting chemotaxis protein n=1 Tax=unclassified Paenibacillus TaxID=185978 RepID=UPI001AE610D6|nr:MULTISPECIES: methyl-accepting chemotaxis protein [unclassified Paenibacillus]MBP1155095.1 transcriptional regulator of acetoin/glycerol metabolism [Paenibacillus sp. PvP091]MBP1169521.1 transcriptional regulator of acetoin/glycerol metabolism [Paenibacillus sp. PvR098]MBP2440549.1 transcriptional regulator of acetoin/glycerol metabolism [Paenibacillus sp. PvP052]
MINKIDSLDSVVAMVPILKAAVPADLSIAICDLEKFIAYFPGETINLNINIGQALNPEEPLTHALRDNKPSKAEVPADFYGFEFTGTATPVHDKDGRVIGGIAVQLRRQTELRNIADQISESLSQANQRIVNVVEGSNLLAEFTQKLLISSQRAGEGVKNTDEVLSIIKKVADQTNLLGLNAAIEAAHVGDKGRGFEVVAKEIRKLSQETVTSAQTTRETLAHIQEVTKQIGTSIEQIAAIGQEQAASTQQISAFIKQIEEMSNKLKQFAKKL